MSAIVGAILGISGLLFIYLSYVRKRDKTKLGQVALIILCVPGFASGIPMLFWGVRIIIEKETVYENEWVTQTVRGGEAVAVGVFSMLVGLALIVWWVYAHTD
jgi:hypothetical protein